MLVLEPIFEADLPQSMHPESRTPQINVLGDVPDKMSVSSFRRTLTVLQAGGPPS